MPRNEVIVPRHLRIQRAYRDPRPMASRSEEELRALAADIRLRVGEGTTKEQLAAELESAAKEHNPMRALAAKARSTPKAAPKAGGGEK